MSAADLGRLFKVDDVTHPAQYSREVLDVLAGVIARGDHVHDPFAGTGLRLGRLCDLLGATYTGGDIERWPGRDRRVVVADALDPASYPTEPYVLVTSPVYVNKRLGDYCDGPRPTTRTRGRRDYGIALGRALHPDNLARTTGRPHRADEYWRRHATAVELWARRARRVVVNVDEPIAEGWAGLLDDAGYQLEDVMPVRTRRYRGLANSDQRAEHEVVIVAACTTDAAEVEP